MSGTELANHLRLLSGYHMGTDLVDRLATAERSQKQQREALAQAADEIERLNARVRELEGQATPPSAAHPAPTAA
jgi:BMFP domain-containing protein YqiC